MTGTLRWLAAVLLSLMWPAAFAWWLRSRIRRWYRARWTEPPLAPNEVELLLDGTGVRWRLERFTLVELTDRTRKTAGTLAPGDFIADGQMVLEVSRGWEPHV